MYAYSISINEREERDMVVTLNNNAYCWMASSQLYSERNY